MKEITRPSWDEIWMQTAHAIAERSLCSRAKIGCVIVTRDQRIEAASYNGPPPAFDHRNKPCIAWCERGLHGVTTDGYDNCPANHAEANAISRSNWSELDGATLYVTSSMCKTCAKLVLATGIKRVVQVVYDKDVHRKTEETERFLRLNGIDVTRWEWQ
jgi:dCMP deaminase